MRNRILSPTGDYTWGSSELNFYINSPAAVGQAAKTRLLLWQGEWFLDTDIGTPYLAGIIGKHPKAMADTTIQDQVSGTQGFLDISQFESTLTAQRVYSATMTIDTIYGSVQVETVVLQYPGGFPYLTTESGEPLVTESGEPLII